MIRERYQGTPWLRFERNAGNIQGNANIAYGFPAAEGFDYLWILADDTIIVPNALELILDGINRQPDLILLSNAARSVQELHFTAPDIDFLLRSGIALISNGIFRMDAIRDDLAQAFEFHNSSFPHLAVLLSALKRASSWDVVQLPIAAVHEDNIPDFRSDYSASMAGYPLLLPLLPTPMQRREALFWLAKYGLLFRKSRKSHRSSYDAASAEMRRQLGIGYPITYLFGIAVGFSYYKLRNRTLGKRIIQRLGRSTNA